MAESINLPSPSTNRFVTGEESARWLGIHEDTFGKMISNDQFAGWLKPVRIGRRVMYASADIAVLAHILERNPEAGAFGEKNPKNPRPTESD